MAGTPSVAQLVEMIADATAEIAEYEAKIAYYTSMAESNMRTVQLAKYGRLLSKAKDALAGLEKAKEAAEAIEAAEAAQTALVPATETAPAVVGGTTSAEVATQVLGGIGRVVTFGAAEGGVAVAAGVGAVAVIGIILTWLAASAAGTMAADKPIDPVAPRSAPTSPNVTPFTPPPSKSNDMYYIYAVNTSGWSLYVGRTGDVEGRKASSFVDGGNGTALVEFKKVVAQPFETSDKAIAYLKANVSTGHHSRWTGTWVKLGGEEFRDVHVGNLGK